MSSKYEKIIDMMTTSDIVTLVNSFGVPETTIRYFNDALIMPTCCHNEIIAQASHKLYYYEDTKKFMCYTQCHQMSVFDFIIASYKARGLKYTPSQAATIMEQIIDQRLSNGFAIIAPPKVQSAQVTVEDNWKDSLTEYNPAVLDSFSVNQKFLALWENEDIDHATMEKYGIRYDMVRNRMVIPIHDDRGRLVGVKVRNFNKWEIDNGRKYMPLYHNNEAYTYEKMKVAYGLNFNKQLIKKTKTVIIFEAEKSVLKFNSFFTMNKSIAVGGSSISIYHIQLLKDLGVETIVIAFDNDFSKFADETGSVDKYYGLKKAIREANRLVGLGFKVELIYDYEQKYLENNDSPVDRGREIYNKLYRERKTFDELKDKYLNDNGEEQEEEKENATNIQIKDF